jgi:hypothetical protein
VSLIAVMALGAGILCSALPAWRSVRRAPSDALRAEARTFSAQGRSGHVLIGAQVALSLVILAAAGVLVRALIDLRALDTGIERTDEVVVAYPEAAHPGAYEGVDNDSYYRQVLSRLEAVPGVERASISLLKPGAGGGFPDAVIRYDAPAPSGVAATRSPVSPGFFEAIGIRLVKGRDFEWRDHSRAPGVTVLSESLARRLFGTTDPIGQRVRLGFARPVDGGLEVIGVVRDARLYNLRSDDTLVAYTPALQDPAVSFKCFVVQPH